MGIAAYQTYLESTRIPLRLASRTESGWPINLSMWFLYEDEALYCATSNSARIVRYLEKDPRCAFEVASDLPPYCGVRGQAEGGILPQRGAEILERLLQRYLGGSDNPLAVQLLEKSAEEVAIRLEPVTVHAWNFTDRMRASLPSYEAKPCP